MLTAHAGYSVVATLHPDKAEAAELFLKDLISKTGSNNEPIFSLCPSTLFVSGVIVPKQDYHGETLPATLLLLTSFSGPARNHLDELIQFYAAELRNLFKHCLHFPDEALHSDQHLKKFLKKRKYDDTFFSGIKNITCLDIGREEKLRKEISNFVDQCNNTNGFQGLSAIKIREQIRSYIKEKGKEFAWVEDKCKPTILDRFTRYKSIFLFALALVPLIMFILGNKTLFHAAKYLLGGGLIAFILYVVSILVIFRRNEIKSVSEEKTASDKHLRTITATQKYPVMNEITVAGPLKKGWVRRRICKTVLKLATLLIRTGHNIPTIATARWLSIDSGKRLVFISNFANISTSYVRDFIDCRTSAMLVNLIFGNGNGYPKTRWLISGGALDYPDEFMNVFQQNQLVTEFWYWPYRDLNLSADSINNNRKIRNGLFSDKSEEEAMKWLLLL